MRTRDGNTAQSAMSKEKRPGAYLLECSDGTLYGGWTNDIQARLKCHNSGHGAKYTRARLPVKLVYWEECEDKQAAMRLEYRLKQMTREQKLRLIADNQEEKQ